MTKNEKVIELLNRAVAMEMTGVHQYMYSHFRLDDMGYEPLANLFKRTAIVEMTHIETLAERIFFLKGDVKMVMDSPVEQIADVEKMLAKGVRLERDTIKAYTDFAKECGENDDLASKKLFERLIEVEEEHEDQYDTEDGNLEKFGKEYLALQAVVHSQSLNSPKK